MNFNWKLVKAGIAGLGYVGIQKQKEKYWSLSTLKIEKNKLRKSLVVNMWVRLMLYASWCFTYKYGKEDVVRLPS